MLNHNNGVSAAVANQHQGTSSPLQFPNSPNPNFSSNQPGGPSLVSSSIEALMRSKFELLDQVKHTMHGVSHAIPGKNFFGEFERVFHCMFSRNSQLQMQIFHNFVATQK